MRADDNLKGSGERRFSVTRQALGFVTSVTVKPTEVTS